MTLAPYPEYKDSGVEWIGSVPVGWSVVALKRDLHFLTSGSRGWADHYADEGALFLRIGNLTRDGLDLDLADIQRVAVPAGAEGERTRVEPGDVLFSITAFMGSVAVVPANLECAYVSQHVALARLRGDLLLPRWVGYATLSAAGKAHLDAQCYGGTKIQLSLDDVANLPVAVPSLAEQIAITTFLDQETGKIDALVAEQERLIALLKEKRQAVISQAVTKGLNPNAPMKDSGIEWLGHVPAHWEVGRLSQFCTGISTGPFGTALGSQDYVTDGVPVINPSHIINGRCVPASDVTVSTETAERLSIWTLAAGDIITARRGELGRAAVVGEAEGGWICGTGSLRLRPKGNLSLSQFLFLVFECRYTREWLELSSVGSTMANINEVIMGGLPIALPLSDAEREQISLYVDYESSKIDALITDATQAITLLRERRAALISAAITGKIDVRSLTPTEQEAA